jgi:hypothetical protein
MSDLEKIVKKEQIKISELLPPCYLDSLFENCSPIQVLKKVFKNIKLCSYRILDKETNTFRCKWEIENLPLMKFDRYKKKEVTAVDMKNLTYDEKEMLYKDMGL